MGTPIKSAYLGSYFKAQRIKQGIAQNALAEAIGCSAQFLGRIEKEEVAIPERLLVGLIKHLKVSPKQVKRRYLKACEEQIDAIFQ